MQLSQVVENLLTATVEVCKQQYCTLISGELMNPRLFQLIKRWQTCIKKLSFNIVTAY